MSTLSYNEPRRLEHRPAWYRTAIWCGLAPIIIGTILFVIFLFTQWVGVAAIGVLFAFVVGVPMLVSGLCLLIAYAWRERRIQQALPPTRKLVVALAILLSGPALAFAYMLVGHQVLFSYHVTIVNRSSIAETGVLIDGAGVNEDVSSISPGQTLNLTVFPQSDGSLHYRSASHQDIVLKDYVCRGVTGRTKLTLTSTGPIVE